MLPLPAPYSPGGSKARGPSEQAACRQGSQGMVVETLKWGPVLVRRVTLYFPPLPEKLGWAFYQHPDPAQAQARQAN